MNNRKNQYVTFYGTSIKSKYGYAAELESVSRDYAKAIATYDYLGVASMDIVTAMDEKYQSLKKNIEDNYTGAEKKARLSELDSNYDFIIDAML